MLHVPAELRGKSTTASDLFLTTYRLRRNLTCRRHRLAVRLFSTLCYDSRDCATLVIVARQSVTPFINIRSVLFRNWLEKRFVSELVGEKISVSELVGEMKFDWFLSWLDEFGVAF